jgi:tRNA(Ile)-lysidine synthase
MPVLPKKFHSHLLSKIRHTLSNFQMLNPQESILIGVSGGPDSMLLLHSLSLMQHEFQLKLGVAHLNHALRGENSNQDEAFVKQWARMLNIACYSETISVKAYQKKHTLSLEEAARQVRYDFYCRMARQHGFNKIALGHHRDDNAEVVLMALLRGSGPLGLSGIKPIRTVDQTNLKIIRPLIHLSKKEITDWLKTNNFPFVSDATNQDTQFLRNKIRHELIPSLINDYNPQTVTALNQLSTILQSEEAWIDNQVRPLLAKMIIKSYKDHIILNHDRFCSYPIAVQRRCLRMAIRRLKGDLKRISYQHIEAVIDLVSKQKDAGPLNLPSGLSVSRTENHIVIAKLHLPIGSSRLKHSDSPGLQTIKPFEYTLHTFNKLYIKEVGLKLSFYQLDGPDLTMSGYTGQQSAFFDMIAIKFPLVIRNFQPGDRFTPLGMTGTQKLKKFFIDHKIPRARRSGIPILTSQNQIIWIMGYRIDDRYKVSSTTQNILKAEIALA